MEKLILFFKNWWLPLAFIMSIYWGVRAIILFTPDLLKLDKEKSHFLCRKHPRLAAFLEEGYQFIFNFISSLLGWCCFYVLVIRIENNPEFNNFTGGDIVLFIFSLLGLTGNLPHITYGFVQSFSELTQKVIGSKK